MLLEDNEKLNMMLDATIGWAGQNVSPGQHPTMCGLKLGRGIGAFEHHLVPNLIVPHLLVVLLPSPYLYYPLSAPTHTRHKLIGRKFRMDPGDEVDVAGWRL